ncbi:MAG: hypothetical protein IT460_01250 [Planctomycetes bacterium]|nr:hypothetical protein [Planctomycetota bacterium]
MRPRRVRASLLSSLAASVALAACTAGTGDRRSPAGMPPAPAAPSSSVAHVPPESLEPVPPLSSRCGFDDASGPLLLRWTGARAPLVRRGPPEQPRARLVADARDARGTTTELFVDTGTSCAFVSMTAPAASTATMDRRRLRLSANDGASSFDGRDGVLPSLDVGGLVAQQVPAFFLERGHDLRRPANIAGMAWLGSLALVHDAAGDRWALEQGTSPNTDARPGTVRLEAPGFPVVALVDERGRRVFALVDTGTPTSLVRRTSRPGRYRLFDARGALCLEVDAKTTAPWTGLTPRGRDVEVWIGLDDLARASFRLDFAAGTWWFPTPAPAAPPTPR